MCAQILSPAVETTQNIEASADGRCLQPSDCLADLRLRRQTVEHAVRDDDVIDFGQERRVSNISQPPVYVLSGWPRRASVRQCKFGRVDSFHQRAAGGQEPGVLAFATTEIKNPETPK